MPHDGTKLYCKLGNIKPRGDWKEGLEKLLESQFELVKVWDAMKNERQYKMTILTTLDTGQNDENDVKIVCISDTHGGHDAMDIPAGTTLIDKHT